MKRSKSCLQELYSAIRTSFFSTSRPTTWISVRSNGWKNFWSTLKIRWSWYPMTVISWIRSAPTPQISTMAKFSSMPVTMTSGTNLVSWWSVRWKKQTKRRKKKSRNYRTLSPDSVPTLPNPNRLLPENVLWKKSSWMRSVLPAVNIRTLISVRNVRSAMKYWW